MDWRQLQATVRRILLDNWDPLGVRDIPAAEDEYDTQVDAIVSMIGNHRASFEELRRYLDDEAYALLNSWDDDAALDRTAKLLMHLALPDAPTTAL